MVTSSSSEACSDSAYVVDTMGDLSSLATTSKAKVTVRMMGMINIPLNKGFLSLEMGDNHLFKVI